MKTLYSLGKMLFFGTFSCNSFADLVQCVGLIIKQSFTLAPFDTLGAGVESFIS